MKLKKISLKQLIVWCATQFRSKFVFMFLSGYRPRVILEWHWNEAHHGKVSMNGVGGTVKNVVFGQINAVKVTINKSAEFCRASNKHVSELSHFFSKPVIYWKNKTILIIRLPSLTPYKLIDGQKVVMRMEHQHLIFKLSNEDNTQFSQEYVSTQRLGYGHPKKE